MIKKTLLMALFFTASALKLGNAFQLPMDRDGADALTVQDVGVDVFLSTSEVPWLINGATQTLAADGTIMGGSSIAVYGILTSTFSGDASAYAYVELRATNTANSVSELLVPPIAVGITTSTTGSLHWPINNLVVFNPPIVAADNLCVRISSALGPLTTYRYNAAIFYRYLATNAPEDVWIPTDSRMGMKVVGGASFYGVKSASNTFGNNVSDDREGTEELDFDSGPDFIQTSSVPANQSMILLYGWAASSGSVSSWFDVDEATGIGDYRVIPNVVTSSFTALPKVYPRTFNSGYIWNTPILSYSVPTSQEFSFPWPIRMRKGLRFWESASNERFRLRTRNAKALR